MYIRVVTSGSAPVDWGRELRALLPWYGGRELRALLPCQLGSVLVEKGYQGDVKI